MTPLRSVVSCVAPGLVATSNDAFVHLVVTPSAPPGPTHSYTVIATNNGGDSAASASVPGNRAAYAVSGSELSLNGGASWMAVGATYDDNTAAAGVVTPGTASATDATQLGVVTLTLSDSGKGRWSTAGDYDTGSMAMNYTWKGTAKFRIPTAALVVMPNAGHGINTEDPGAFNAHLADFFHTVDLGKWPARDPRALVTSILGNR